VSQVSVTLAGLSGALLIKVVFILPVEMKAAIIKLSWRRKLFVLRLCYKVVPSEVDSCLFLNHRYQIQVLGEHMPGPLSISAPDQLNLFNKGSRQEAGIYRRL
jgi:hypothetical protein